MILIVLFLVSTAYSQEWIQGKGFPFKVTAIEIAEYDSSIVFVGTHYHGLWRRDFSTDEGWVEINSGYAQREYSDEEMNQIHLWYRGDYYPVEYIETSSILPNVVY